MEVIVLFFAAGGLCAGSGGAPTPQLTIRCDPPAGSLSRLNRSQKQAFLKAEDQLIANHPSEALATLRTLLAEVRPNTPVQIALAERTAEAAIEAGDRSYAISLLKPIEAQDADDCPARTLLARAYAEEGNAAERDSEISAVTALHRQSPQSPGGKLDVFLLERHSLPAGGVMQIWYYLQPQGPHNTYFYSQILSESGSVILLIELDSDDTDQRYFRETHPDLAAKGDRQFSLDAFEAQRTLPDGKVEYPHTTIRFFDGKPAYNTVRDLMLTLASRFAAAKPGQ